MVLPYKVQAKNAELRFFLPAGASFSLNICLFWQSTGNLEFGNLREVGILATYGKSGFWQSIGNLDFGNPREIWSLTIYGKF